MIEKHVSFEQIGIRFVEYNFPKLIVGLCKDNLEILLHIDASNYDYLPVRGWWVDKNDNPLKHGIPLNKGFHYGQHPHDEDRSWLCFKGWREYHDHPSHQNVSWYVLKHNPDYKPLGLLTQLVKNLNGSGINIQ